MKYIELQNNRNSELVVIQTLLLHWASISLSRTFYALGQLIKQSSFGIYSNRNAFIPMIIMRVRCN